MKFTKLMLCLSILLSFSCYSDFEIEESANAKCNTMKSIGCIDVLPDRAYGQKVFDVSPKHHWVNSGLFLKKGETATIQETGKWSSNLAGDGTPTKHNQCLVGRLVARIGLRYNDQYVYCVNKKLKITAHKDGILYLGMALYEDSEDSLDKRIYSTGLKTVKVTSKSFTVPVIQSNEYESYNYDLVKSGWVEIISKHLILTVPSKLAKKDKRLLKKSIDHLDSIYVEHKKLRGFSPYSGQRIRIYADNSIGDIGAWMLAGNPIRISSSLLDTESKTRITNSTSPDFDLWGIVHELGHDFAHAKDLHVYRAFNTNEAWPNLFTVNFYEKNNISLRGEVSSCKEGQVGKYIDDTGKYWSNSPWIALCFLRQFSFKFGWQFYMDFFQKLNQLDNKSLDLKIREYDSSWVFIYNMYLEIAQNKKDKNLITSIFQDWGVPTKKLDDTLFTN